MEEENCWRILDVDAATATEREVKAAYARLLKLHRPDADPKGFQIVRSAYLAALAELRTGVVEFNFVPQPAEPTTDILSRPREMPDRSRNALAALKGSLGNGNESASLLRFQTTCFADQVPEGERQEEIFAVFQGQHEQL